MIQVKINDLLFINKFKSKEATRIYLQGVLFCRGGVIAATDGHMLGKMQESYSGELKNDFILDLDKDTIKFLTGKVKKNEFVSLEFCENGIAVELTAAGETHIAGLIDHALPPFEHLFGVKQGAIDEIALNPKLLEQFAGGGKLNGVKMIFNNESFAAITIKNPNFGDRFTGLLMPMRL